MGLDISAVTVVAGYVIYTLLALLALWGAFCVIVVWRRVDQTRFRSEEAQAKFMDQVDEQLARGDFDAAAALCDGDHRAMPQLVRLALANRSQGYAKLRRLVVDRFQRDVLADLEHRLNWVQTVIRSAPMVGLLGTVIGMMGAFARLRQGDRLDPTLLAGDISLALVTTAIGLGIAIPLVLATASINVRIRKLEDLVGQGLTLFFENLKQSLDPSLAGSERP